MEHDTTLTALLNEGLRMAIRETPPPYESGGAKLMPKAFHLSTVEGEMLPGIDPTSTAQMLDIADGVIDPP